MAPSPVRGSLIAASGRCGSRQSALCVLTSAARVPRPQTSAFHGVGLPPTSATGADVTADTACSEAPVIVDIYLAHKEVAVHANPDAGPDARIATFAGLRPVLGQDRLRGMPGLVSPYGRGRARKVQRGTRSAPRPSGGPGRAAGPALHRGAGRSSPRSPCRPHGPRASTA